MTGKRICILTWDDVQAKGGVGRTFFRLEEALSEICHYTIASPSNGFLSWTKRIVGGHFFFSFFASFLLPFYRKKESYDVIIFPVGPGGVFPLFLSGVRVAVCHHTYAQQSRLVPGQWWKAIFIPLERFVLRSSHRVCCYCADTRTSLETEYGIQNVESFPLIYPLESWNVQIEKNTPPRIVCVARLEQRKNVSLLLDAWETLQQTEDCAELIIVGRGVQSSSLDAKIAALQRVQRIAFLPLEELVQLVASSTVLVAPSFLEGFGLSILEAMVAGTTVVATDIEGQRCLICHGKTGILTESNSAARLSGALQEILHDAERRTVLERNAQQFALQEFDQREAKQALHTFIDSL